MKAHCVVPRVNQILVKEYLLQILRTLQYKNLPQLIVYLCIKFFNPTDTWSRKLCHPTIQIDDLNVVRRQKPFGYKSVFLQNVASSGIHIWKFQINFSIYPGYDFIEIGIEHAFSNHSHTMNFGLSYRHKREFRKTYWEEFPNYCKNKFTEDDHFIVEMRLNLITQTISFYKNLQCLSKMAIHKVKYRAAVTLSGYNLQHPQSVQLLSYQKIVC